MHLKTRDLTHIAIMAGMLCALGPLTVAIGPIPLSLASFAVYLSGAMLGWKRGTAAVGIYLLIGLMGVPVFAGFSAGLQKLIGVTGGYLIGYLPCALITGLGVPDNDSRDRLLPLRMAIGTAALYIVGTAWFMFQTGNPPGAALAACVVPFLPGDALKIVATTVIAPSVRRAALKAR